MFCSSSSALKSASGRQLEFLSELRLTSRQIAVQLLTLSVQVSVLFGTFREGYVRQFFEIGIRHRHIETIADVANTVHVHFLNLVRDVLTFSGIAHTITFNGMRGITVG